MKNWRETISQMVVAGVEHRRQRGLKVSEAHSVSHLRNVAELTQKVGALYGFTKRENELAFAVGWFHDVIRSPSEDPRIRDEEASAKEARRILEEAGLIAEEEKVAIVYAIERQSRYPEWLGSPHTREKFPETLQDKLHFVLFVADKMEANGV